MTTIKGIELDLARSSNNDFNWELVFTPGSFLSVNTSIQTQAAMIRLNKKDYIDCAGINVCLYNIFYNPIYNKYSIINQGDIIDVCDSNGYLIGGFQIKNCQMSFVAPNSCNGVIYERNFTPEYNKAFAITELSCDDDCKGDFNNEAFNEAYDTSCVVVECEGGAFKIRDFDNSYDDLPNACSNNTFDDSFSNEYSGGSAPSVPTPPILLQAFGAGFDAGFGS